MDNRHNANVGVQTEASAEMGGGLAMAVLGMKSLYRFECLDSEGNVKWVEEIENLVTNEGLNDVLNKYFKGSSYTAAFYVGLKLTGTIAAGDTLASHAGWTEASSYTGNRQAITLGTVASQSVNNSGAVNAFAITGTMTVTGGFLCTVATGTSGVLYGAAEFSVSRAVINGDTLNVTVTLTAASA
jgi:hypothetical protein